MKKPYKRMKPLLGTFVEIGISEFNLKTQQGIHFAELSFDEQSDILAPLASEVFDSIKLIQSLLSFYNPESELSKLNSSNGQSIKLSPHTITVLQYAKQIEKLSGGLFNCTWGGKLVNDGHLPHHGWKDFLEVGTEQDIEIQGASVRLLRPILVTLDGIAKGYAVDLAVEKLKYLGVQSGWINAGGDLRVFGGTSLPLLRRNLDRSLSSLGTFQNISVASSKLENTKDETFPGKILSSHSEQPEAGVWTIAAPEAWRADALTKVAALVESGKRAELIQQLGGQYIN